MLQECRHSQTSDFKSVQASLQLDWCYSHRGSSVVVQWNREQLTWVYLNLSTSIEMDFHQRVLQMNCISMSLFKSSSDSWQHITDHFHLWILEARSCMRVYSHSSKSKQSPCIVAKKRWNWFIKTKIKPMYCSKKEMKLIINSLAVMFHLKVHLKESDSSIKKHKSGNQPQLQLMRQHYESWSHLMIYQMCLDEVCSTLVAFSQLSLWLSQSAW